MVVRPHFEYAMQACSPNLFFTDADCWCESSGLATRLVKDFRRQSHEELLRTHIKCSLRIRFGPGLVFIPPVRPGKRGHPFKVLQGLVGVFAESRLSQYGSFNFGSGFPPLLLSLLPLSHSITNLIQHGFQKFFDPPPPFIESRSGRTSNIRLSILFVKTDDQLCQRRDSGKAFIEIQGVNNAFP